MNQYMTQARVKVTLNLGSKTYFISSSRCGNEFAIDHHLLFETLPYINFMCYFFRKRLPCGEVEKARKAIRTFFLLRGLSLSLQENMTN